MEKLYLWKTCFKMAGGGLHPPHPAGPAPARTDNNVSYHYSNQSVWLWYDVRQIVTAALT